jgi:hypothetical protein
MKWIVLLFLLAMNALAMNTAHATDDVFKCNVKGHSVYQSTPCPGATAVAPREPAGTRNDAMPGCYIGRTPGFGDAFEITAGVGGEFNVAFTDGGHEQTMTMRMANAHDLQAVNAQFHLHLRTGITMEWTPNFPSPETDRSLQGQGRKRERDHLRLFRIRKWERRAGAVRSVIRGCNVWPGPELAQHPKPDLGPRAGFRHGGDRLHAWIRVVVNERTATHRLAFQLAVDQPHYPPGRAKCAQR